MDMILGDEQLVKDAACGDTAAFRMLLERHYDMIFRIGLRFTGHREDAEDIAQEVCISLPKKLASFQGRSKFTTWLYQVVLNTIRDQKRKQTSQAKTHETYGELTLLERGAAEDTADQTDRLYAMLDEVGHDLKETAILILAEDMNHREAAEILGVKESTISWRMHELKKKLKTLAEQET